MAQFIIFLNIASRKLIIAMKQHLNFYSQKNPKKTFPYHKELDNNTLYWKIWEKKPKLNSIEELNQIGYIVNNL